MSARSKAIIKPELLTWARKSAGYEIAEAAEALKVDAEKLSSWESIDDPDSMPSIAQLRKIAQLFKRPLAVFYLPEPPLLFQPMRDLRRLPGVGFRRFSSNLLLETRLAADRRDLALNLFADAQEEIPEFVLTAKLNENAETVGARIRESLGVAGELDNFGNDATGRTALNTWRSRIEGLGVLVFQATRLGENEASGFALAEKILPVIVINRKDAPTRRTFSLFHEFAHLMLRTSGVSDLDVDAQRPPEDHQIEVFCNQVAAAALLPADALVQEARERNKRPRSTDWEATELAELSKRWGVSREALLRRYLNLGLTTPEFYRERRQEYLEEYEAFKRRQKDAVRPEGIPRNMPQETVSNFGRPLVHIVLHNYYRERITLSDVSGYLSLKTKHIGKLEKLAGLR